jgi:hypothetical protein
MIHLELSDAMDAATAGGVVIAAATVLVGPVVCRDGGFAFDTCTPAAGIRRGFAYRRVEQAEYDRRSTLLGVHLPAGAMPTACDTVAAFAAASEALTLAGAPFAFSPIKRAA